MNNVNLVGRFTRDPEMRYTSNGVAVANFTLAVRNYYKDDGKGADFIKCVVWQRPAELIAESHRQGDLIAVSGRLETRSYENKDGEMEYVTEVIVENFDFIKPKQDDEGESSGNRGGSNNKGGNRSNGNNRNNGKRNTGSNRNR